MPLFSSIKDGSFFSDIKGGSKLSDIKAVGYLSSNVAKVTKLVNRINQPSAQSQQQQQQPYQPYQPDQSQLYGPSINVQQPCYQPYQTQQGYNQQSITPDNGAGNAASKWAPASCQAFTTTGLTDSTNTTQDNPYGNASLANINAEESDAADEDATSAIDEVNEFTSVLNDNFYGQTAADEGGSLVDDDDDAAPDVDNDDIDNNYDDGVERHLRFCWLYYRE